MNAVPVKYRVFINGTAHEVTIKTGEQGLYFEVDGKTLQAQLLEIPGGLSFLSQQGLYPIWLDAQMLHTRKQSFPYQVHPFSSRWHPEHAEHMTEGAASVQCPMPGRVLKILARKGDTVEANQVLMVVEAMKMENEIRAGQKGRITALHVHEGQSVDRGTLLVDIED